MRLDRWSWLGSLGPLARDMRASRAEHRSGEAAPARQEFHRKPGGSSAATGSVLSSERAQDLRLQRAQAMPIGREGQPGLAHLESPFGMAQAQLETREL